MIANDFKQTLAKMNYIDDVVIGPFLLDSNC